MTTSLDDVRRFFAMAADTPAAVNDGVDLE
jgi:hypothetical protein